MGWEAKAAYMESRAKQRLQDAAAVCSFLLYFLFFHFNYFSFLTYSFSFSFSIFSGDNVVD